MALQVKVPSGTQPSSSGGARKDPTSTTSSGNKTNQYGYDWTSMYYNKPTYSGYTAAPGITPRGTVQGTISPNHDNAAQIIGGSPYVFGTYGDIADKDGYFANTNTAYAAGQNAKAINDLRNADPYGGGGGYGYGYGGGGGYDAAAAKQAAMLAEIDRYLAEMNSLSQRNLDEGSAYYKNAYDASIARMKAQAEDLQRQNYINSQINKRDFRQINSAMGLTGGASETALASILNQYNRSRNATDAKTLDNQAALEAEYNKNLYELQKEHAANLMNNQNNALSQRIKVMSI